MEKELFTYCLERSTNVQRKKVDEILNRELLKLVLEIEEAQKDLESVQAECVAEMEKAYSVHQDSVILKAKRKMLSFKAVPDTIEIGFPECLASIEKYNKAAQKKEALASEFTAMYAETLDENRERLQEFAKSNPEILRVLPLINIDFDKKLMKYIQVPVKEHNAKIRKLDHQLVRLFTRSTMKTSPFSYLTSVCLYDVNGEENRTEDGVVKSICEANNYILKAIYDFTVAKKEFAYQIDYRLNAHKEYDDGFAFLYQRDYEKGKVYKTVDGMSKFKKAEIIKAMVGKYGNQVFSFDQMVKGMIDDPGDYEKMAEICYEKFIKTNIITPHLSVDETKTDIFKDFYEKMGRLKDNEEGILTKVTSLVHEYEERLKEFENADWERRFDLIHEIDELVCAVESLLECQFVHNILVYEDTIYKNPKKPIYADEFSGYGLDKLQRLFRIFDQSIMTYLLFSEMYKEKYGDRKINAADIDIYKLFVEASSSLSNVWRDNFSEISFETISIIKKISELKKHFLGLIKESKDAEKPVDLRKEIDRMISENPDVFESDIDSATFFLQKAEEGDLIINKVYKGQLLFFTRFLKLDDCDTEKIRNYCSKALGKNPMEITESFGFNANVHDRILDKRLLLNLTDQNDKDEDTVDISDCYFYYDYEKKLVKLGREGVGEVNGIYLGSLAYNLMPIPLRTINGMQPTTRFDATFLNLWDISDKENLIADSHPRFSYGNIVLMRKQYLVNSIYDLTKAPEELYKEVVSGFRKAGLPERFFIRPYINGSDFDFINMTRTSLKPQFIDLSSPLLFQELLREMENQKQFIVEEAYPDNEKEDYIYEYEIEQTIYK